MRPREVVQPGFALVGVPFPLVGQGVALLGTAFSLISDLLALLGVPFPLISDLLAPVGVPSGLAGQSAVFLPGAFSFSLPPGFVPPQGGLAAFDGLPAPGHRGPGPGQRLLGAFLPVW